MEIDQRIPDLSDKELENLHANAVRLEQSGTQIQRQHAERLLPLLSAGQNARLFSVHLAVHFRIAPARYV